MSNNLKEFIAGFFKPFLPEVFDYLVSKILSQDLRLINTLIFTGILEILMAFIGGL